MMKHDPDFAGEVVFEPSERYKGIMLGIGEGHIVTGTIRASDIGIPEKEVREVAENVNLWVQVKNRCLQQALELMGAGALLDASRAEAIKTLVETATWIDANGRALRKRKEGGRFE